MKSTMSSKKIARRLVALAVEMSRDLEVLVTFSSHVLLFYCWCCFAFPVKWQTLAFVSLILVISVTVNRGAIFYWTRGAFRENQLLECLLLFMFASSGQMSMVEYVRSHYNANDSSNDPKHDCIEEDQDHFIDVTKNNMIMFYERYVLLWNMLLCVFVPTCVCVLWGDSWLCAAVWQALRYLIAAYLPKISQLVTQIPDYDTLGFLLRLHT